MRLNKYVVLFLVMIYFIFFNAVNANARALYQAHDATVFLKSNRSQHVVKRRAALMILVSSAVPMASLRHYLADALAVHATLVLRGFVNNTLQDTAVFIKHLRLNTNSSIKIDPIVFEKLHVTSVPAIVLFNAKGLACINQRDCVPLPKDYDLVRGNVTLSYALNEIAEHGRALPSLATVLLDILRRANHV